MSNFIASLYDHIVKPFDSLGVRRWRQWAVSAARGRALEIGVGSGLNLLHYRNANSVAAIDPALDSLQHALKRRNKASVPIMLCCARAEALPFASDTFDSVVGTLTFCSIGEPMRALNEVQRVLKINAPFRLVEHVRTHNRLIAWLQDIATPYWKQIAGNCHLNRDTASTVEQAGFALQRVHRLLGGFFIGIDAVNSLRR